MMTTAELVELNERAWSLRENEPAAGRELAERAAARARADNDRRELAKALRTAGACGLVLGEHAEARRILQEAAELAAEPGVLADVQLLLTRCSFLEQQFETALRHGQLALSAAQEAGDAQQEARALNDLGLVYAHLGATRQALDYLIGSLQVLESADIAPAGGPLNNLGNIYLQLEEPDRALECLERALQTFRDAGSDRDEAIALGNIARAHEARGELREALHYGEESLRVARDSPDPSYVAPAWSKLGAILTRLGAYERARDCFDEALAAHARQPEPGAFQDETLLALAELHVATGEIARAQPLYAGLQEDARASGDRALLQAALLGLARVEEAAGRWREALEHYRAYHELTRELDRELFSSQTRALLLQREVDRSRREQELLVSKNQELERAYEKLQELHRALEAQAEELRRLSLEDALTGLNNRRQLERRAREEFAARARYGGEVSMMMADIDGFKSINDRYSHGVGDEILAAVGAILRRQVRQVDVPARIGGDEFVVLFPAIGLAEAVAAAEKIRRAVEAYAWAGIRPGLCVTLSIGVAGSEQGGDWSGVLDEADEELYRAKKEGRNRVCFAGQQAPEASARNQA